MCFFFLCNDSKAASLCCWKRSSKDPAARLCSAPDFWWPRLFQMCIVYLISRCDLQTYPFFLSDCQMRFTSHMSHICRLSSLNGSVNDVNVSRCECRVTSVGSLPHLEVPAIQVICRCCFCSPDLLPSVKNWCQHLSKAKCLFYTECQSSHNLLINQAAKKQILCVCVCVCVSELVCVCTCAATTHPGVLFSHLWKGPLIRKDAIINVSCGFCLKEEAACNVLDAKGRGRVCSGHKAHADCTTTVITGAETRQQTSSPVLVFHRVVFKYRLLSENRRHPKWRILLSWNAVFCSLSSMYSVRNSEGLWCVDLGWITAVGLFGSTVGLSTGNDRSGWINSEPAKTPCWSQHGATMWQTWWYMIGTADWTLEPNDVMAIIMLGILWERDDGLFSIQLNYLA